MITRRSLSLWRGYCRRQSRFVDPSDANKWAPTAIDERLQVLSEISCGKLHEESRKEYKLWSCSRGYHSNLFSAAASHANKGLLDRKITFFAMQRFYSSPSAAEDENIPSEMEMVKKFGWLLKVLAAVTLTYVSFHMFPMMGDSLIWQSVALVRSEDPFMKRSGASRISRIATNDERRKSFVQAGGVRELVKMLEMAPDDKTRREAVKALVSLCYCDVAVEALHQTGAEAFIQSLANESSATDVQSQSIILLQKLDEWKQISN